MIDLLWDAYGPMPEVELYRAKGEWGSRLKPGSAVKIINREKFFAVLTEN
ncbi:MAG: hypothetical protein JNM17_01605 [Archangium sp.]|nr:hypothetical protein [Archangium sp.]